MAVEFGIVVHANVQGFHKGKGVLGVVVHVAINMFWPAFNLHTFLLSGLAFEGIKSSFANYLLLE